MKNIVKEAKSKSKSWMIDQLFSYSGGDYQRNRHPRDKFELISSRIDHNRIKNVLDVGCNEGVITNEFSKLGKFCIGIDVAPYFLNHMLKNTYGVDSPVFGRFSLSPKNVSFIPSFDLVLLLSVHHQWIKKFGDEYAKQTVSELINKSQQYCVIEFAATLEKYGYKEPLFLDNSEESVRKYAESWLDSVSFSGDVEYIGKSREGNQKEPYRFIYMIRRTS